MPSNNPPETAPDIHRGKAIAVTSGAMIVGGGLGALGIVIAITLLSFAVILVWGVGIALMSL